MKVSSSETSSSLVTPKITRINQGQILFWPFRLQLPLPRCVSISPRNPQQLHSVLAEGTTEGRSPFFLPSHLHAFIFSLPPFWVVVTVLTMFALDKQMIVTLKVIRKCFLSTCSFYNHFPKHITLKKTKLFPSNMTTGYKTIQAV